MSNPWFRFKEFTVRQDRCGMKVSTDACIQGAWTPVPASCTRVLDVGAGTGLLSLMVAQRQPDARIDAVEIDAGAAAQAAENIAASPFSDRIRVCHADVRSWSGGQHYDLIICNPPFFKDGLPSSRQQRAIARHDEHLRQDDILGIVRRHLAPGGLLSILLPLPEMQHWDRLAGNAGYGSGGCLSCRDHPGAPPHRRIGLYSHAGCSTAVDEQLYIKDAASGVYSERFRELLRPFYLHL